MLFSVENDSGSSIKAYVIPDSAGTSPSVRIRSEGNELAVVTATVVRPEIVASGRHATGQCGFLINDSVVENLNAYADLEIVEAASGLLIYRRKVPAYLDSKIFRLETHLLPLWRFDDAFKDRFQFWYKGVDRHGSETSTQVFCIHNLDSAYISGRMLFSKIQFYLSQGYRTIAMFRDPFDELAERMIVLKNVGAQATELLGARDAMTYEPVIEALAEIETFDRASCKRFFKRAGEPVFSVLNNPLVRQLTSNSLDEVPTKSCISTALQILAGFEILGLRSDAAGYSQAVAETFDFAPSSVPVMTEFARVTELGNILRDIKDAELLLEHDLELYDHTSRAFGALEAPTPD